MQTVSSDDKKVGPKGFGERFREEGLVGALRKKGKSTKSDPNAMHFLEHLEELRWVILKAVCAFLLGCIGVAVFMQDSVKALQWPLIKAVEDFGEISIDLQSIGLEQYAQTLEKQEVDLGMLRNAKEEQLHGWGISDPHHQTRMLTHFAGGKNRNLLQVIRSYSPIFIAMKICFLGGLGLSLPIILYFVGSFVVPGLTQKEKRVFFPGCVAATLLFLAGASMTYFFILPLSLAFTIEFSFNVLGLDVYRPEAGNYYSTVIWMTFAVGIAFQFPLVLILLVRIGILSVIKLRESRRIVLVILMVSAALITPGGDPVSLCILTIPLYVLYEFAILTGTIVERRKVIREWKEWDEAIQGPRPDYPKADRNASLFYLVSLCLIGAGSFTAWKYQDEITKAIDSLIGEEGTSSPADDENSSQTHSPATPEAINPRKPFESFIIELSPVRDSNSSLPENSEWPRARQFRAKILEN